MSPFRLLFKLFQGRFFESDDVSPGSGFQTNITQVLAFLVTASFAVFYLSLAALSHTVNSERGSQVAWALRGVQLLTPVFAFAVIGFATFFEWDMLFPNRRDFLILTPFPIRPRDILAAQIAALAQFLTLLTIATNLFPVLLTFLTTLFGHSPSIGMRAVGAEIGATVGVSAFAFFAIAALQGVLLNVTTPRLFRRLSPIVQMCGMCLMVLSLLTFPIYMQLLHTAVVHNQLWVWLFPPVWFQGLYDLFLPSPNGFFAALGIHALRMLAGVITLFAITWTVGFSRHYRRTLESEESAPRVRSSLAPAALLRSPEERTLFQFTGKTLARSRKHQLFLLTYLSVGTAVAINFAAAVQKGQLALTDDGARVFPFLIAFFAVSGFRAVFQFPAELPANWLFRLTETRWAEITRAVARKRVLASGLGLTLLLLLPAEIAVWRGWRAPFHTLFQLAAGALLIEFIFWTFDKVPFTCSYFPGRTNLSTLFVLYLYGFSYYSFQMADSEKFLEDRPLFIPLTFAAAALLLVLSWRHRRDPESTRFDASEPTIQGLDLS